MPNPLSSATTLKRIHREIADLKKEDLGAIALAPSSDSLFHWKATIPGPEGSCYEGGVFDVDITLAHDYPFSAPRVTFLTRIYHMNISDRGGVCIDILKHNWSPALSLFKVVLSLSSLLTDPNPKDPLVPSIATEYVRNRPQHDRTARHWTQLYARPQPPPPPPVPQPPVATMATSSPVPGPTTRSKGKTRAAASAGNSLANASTLSSSSRSTTTEPITITDSDDEVTTASGPPSRGLRAGVKRKRCGPGSGADVDLTGEDRDEGAARARRRKSGPSEGDVIVIED